MTVLLETNLPNRTHRGKVRDTYDLGDGRLLIVATDRLSAFDVVLPTGIPNKGAVLSQLSAFWFDLTSAVVPNHLIRLADGTAADDLQFALPPEFIGRTTIVKKAQRLDVECVVRGYVSGTAWADYQKTGTIFGLRMPAGMQESEKLPAPLFTPSTKEEEGHDLPMTYDEVVSLIGEEAANAVKVRSVALYEYAANYALQRGIIIADTKFEFGIVDGEPIVIDEMLTPDSSRFWPAADYEAGRGQNSFDKQFVRDYLTGIGWNREPPAPALPDDIAQKTAQRYMEAYRLLTGNNELLLQEKA
ncbi:MAG: phosphoribosylaminoimidazolesuccinocarboxamide synthase [Dehalococcoidia bacterium]